MKRKYNKSLGFTMIEMLATILVLLVILLIATPSIRRMLNKTNELSKEYVENIIIDSAREYAIVNNKTITSKLKLVGDTSVISLTTLLNAGLIEQSDIDTLGPNARVLLTLKENNYVEYKIVYDGTLVENNASHIVLLGGNPLYVKQGTPYLEPGYISYDRDGKIITDKVLVTGTVNTSVIGNYVLTYKITDELGNTEEEKRTVIVVDNTYPKVTVATTVSNNPYNNKFAKNGERITLNITFSKVVTDPKVTIGGREATLSGSGTTRTATLLIPSDESSLVSNKGLEIKISDYIDEYDNIGQIQTDVTSGGLVVFDNIAPTITRTVIVSNNPSNKLAKNNETITMTQTFSEPVINPSVRISGRVMTSSGMNTNTITSTYLIPSTESTLTEGNLVGSIVQYMDRAGNIGDPSNIKLNGATVVYDRTAPTCVSSGGNASWRNTDLTITGTCTDTGSGCVSATITKVLAATTTTGSPGTVTDKAGNSTACPGNQVANIDKVAPTCVSSGGNATWRNTNLTITGTCTDTGGSGCTSATVTGTLSATTTTGSPGTVTDKAGNSTACPGNQVANIDKVAPTCAVAGGSTTWTGGSRLVTGTCSDTGGSGCVGNISHNYTTDINTTTAGAGGNSVGGTVSDKAGNSTTCPANQTVRVDKTAPAIAESYSGGMLFRDANFSSGTNGFGVYNNSGGGTVTQNRIALSNPYGSYVMRIVTNGVSSPGLGGYVQSVTSRANGVYMHRIIAKIPVGYTIQRAANKTGVGSSVYWITPQAGTGDWQEYIYIHKAGSTSTTDYPFSNFGHVYLTGPGTSVTWDVAYSTIIDTVKQDTTSNIAFRATDAGSGFTHYGINQSSTTQPTYTAVTNSSSLGVMRDKITTNGTYYIWVKDAVGNVSNKAITVNTVDNTAPTVPTSVVRIGSSTGTVRANTTAWSNQTLWWGSFSSTDAGSGVARYEYSTGCTGTVTGTLSTSYTYSNNSHNFCIRAVDNKGNASEWSGPTYIRVDTTAPTVPTSVVRIGSSTGTVRANTTAWSNQTLWWGSFSATDATSGVARYEYSTGCTGTVTGTLGGPYTYSNNAYNFCIRAVDNAGNESAWSTATYIRADTTAPPVPTSVVRIGSSTGTVRANTTAWSTQTLWWGSFSATDATSGIARYEYSTGCTGTLSGTLSTSHTYSNHSYDFCIRAVDNAGNISGWSTATYIRADTTFPTCVSSGGSTAWRNTNLTITGTCSDTGGSGCAGNATKTYSTNTNSTTETPGYVYDNAGNRSASTCPANQTVKIDKTLPTCPTSSGGSTAWRNTNLTITGTCSDTGGSGCAGNATKTYSTNTNSTTETPGYVYDNAGNRSASTCPANQTVKIDKTLPTCPTSSGGSTAWRNTNLTITGTCSDTGGSGCAGNATKTYSTNTNSTTETPGYVYDNAGNRSASTCPANQTVKIDKTAPTCPTSSGGSATWRNTNLTITGTCSDTGGSGCAGNATKTYSTNTNSTTETPGYVYDKAGNRSASTCPANQTVKIDKTAPTCPTSSGGSATWRNTNLTITGTCSDTGGSGCAGNATKTYSTNTNSTTETPGYVYDKAGNRSASTCPANQTVKIDKTAPTCPTSSGGSATWRNTNLTITGTCSDTGGSGCAGNATKTYSTNTNSTTETPGYVYDKAGNRSASTCPANQTVKIDKTAPTCSVAKSNTGTTAGVTATVTATNSPISGISSGTGTFTGLKANATYTITSGAGLTGTCSITVTPQTQHRAQSCSIYASCENAACGYNSCANAACGYKTCTSQSCCGTYCNTSGKIYECYQLVGGYGCGTKCATSKPSTSGQVWYITSTTCCVSSEPATCSKSCCGNATCATAACGNKTCATSACGCSSWGAWGAWSTTACSAQTNVRQCQTQTVYN